VRGPGAIQQLTPEVSAASAQFTAQFGQRRGTVRFGHGQKRLKSGTQIFQLIRTERSGYGNGLCVSRKSRTQLSMQVFLKAGDVNIEPENFRGEWILSGQVLRALNTSLPLGNRHRAIINSVGTSEQRNLLEGSVLISARKAFNRKVREEFAEVAKTTKIEIRTQPA
jgi:hypothetical protein